MRDHYPEEGPTDRSLYWVDLHKHVAAADVEEVLANARRHLDAYAPLLYPRYMYRHGLDGGIREERGGNRSESLADWERIQAAAAEFYEPGSFVTFPAYEWHGDSTRWGHHNVYYLEEGYPLDDEQRLPDLYENMRERDALVLPHHTGFKPGDLGKDWDAYDPDLSPVVEMVDGHGSSEGVGTPVPATGKGNRLGNPSMGPRTTGGNYRDALDRGIRVGAIGSNDWRGLPGSCSLGLGGVWAEELTRSGLWEAIKARRTYGVSGDRISLWWTVDDTPMGGVADASGSVTARAEVDCPLPLEQVEVVHNGEVVAAYTHQDKVDRWDDPDGQYNVLLEVGGGPNPSYADWKKPLAVEWDGRLDVEGGRLRTVHPRYDGMGMWCDRTDDTTVRFSLTTHRGDDDRWIRSDWQGFIVGVEADGDTTLDVALEADDESDLVPETELSTPLGALSGRDRLFHFDDAAGARIADEFGVAGEDLQRPVELERSTVYCNAAKMKLHPAYSRRSCKASIEFDDLPTTTGTDYYYARVSQVNGEYAWSSPVWVE